jgi:hypothetical protein
VSELELEILDFYDGVYRISRIAHYSTFAVGGGHPSWFKASANGRRSPVPSRDATSAI